MCQLILISSFRKSCQPQSVWTAAGRTKQTVVSNCRHSRQWNLFILLQLFFGLSLGLLECFFFLLFIDKSLSDTKLQLGLCRARPVQWRSGGPRAVRSGSAPAPVHLRTWAFCTCQFCQQFSDQRYRTLWQESIFGGD